MCFLLAAIFTGGRAASDIIHAVKGTEPAHLEKARLRAQRQATKAAAGGGRSAYASDKPTVRDVAAVYWGDAMADVIAHHDRVRAEKLAGTRPPVKQRLKRLGKYLLNGSEKHWEKKDQADGPVVSLADLMQPNPTADGPWQHAVPVPTNLAKGDPVERPAPLTYDEQVADLKHGFEFELCHECGKDFDEHTISPDALGLPHAWCKPTEADEAEPRCWCGALAVDGPYCPTHDYRTPPADRALYDGQPYTDLTGVPDDAGSRTCDRCGKPMLPVPGSQHFDADGGAMVSTKCSGCGDIQSCHNWDWTDKPPAEDPDNPDHQDDDQITEPTSNGGTTMSSTATGDVHDVETCDAQLNVLEGDLNAINSALDVLDTAAGEAATAAELIGAWLASKNIDGALGGMAVVQDMLGADRIKELIDAVAAAKQGVETTREAMAPLRDARDLVGAADGSALNGR